MVATGCSTWQQHAGVEDVLTRWQLLLNIIRHSHDLFLPASSKLRESSAEAAAVGVYSTEKAGPRPDKNAGPRISPSVI